MMRLARLLSRPVAGRCGQLARLPLSCNASGKYELTSFERLLEGVESESQAITTETPGWRRNDIPQPEGKRIALSADPAMRVIARKTDQEVISLAAPPKLDAWNPSFGPVRNQFFGKSRPDRLVSDRRFDPSG